MLWAVNIVGTEALLTALRLLLRLLLLVPAEYFGKNVVFPDFDGIMVSLILQVWGYVVDTKVCMYLG